MKKNRFILPLLAFVFAIGSAFSSAPVFTAYYDSNGSSSGGAASGSVSDDCAISSGTICQINNQWAFDTEGHAEDNEGMKTDTNALGLLKRP
jgi:hypothetical protein